VGILVLAVVFLLTVAIGAVLAKGVLTVVLRLIVEGQLPAPVSLRLAGFLVALITFWSLAPAIVDSPVTARIFALVR
jgi:hypothetical protein